MKLLQSVKENIRAKVAVILALMSPAAFAATALEDAIDGLVTGVLDGVTVTIASIVPLLVLVFGFAFAIRWVSSAIRK